MNYPYSIKYQQADGNWSDNTDQSGNIADKKNNSRYFKKSMVQKRIKKNKKENRLRIQ